MVRPRRAVPPAGLPWVPSSRPTGSVAMLIPPRVPRILRCSRSYTTTSCAVKGFFQVARRPPADRPTRLGDVLRAALERLPEAERLADHAVWAHWDAVVGPTIARHARPERMRRGVLLVAVDGPEWMQELQFLKHELRERLNARLGRPAVRALFLVLAGGA